MDHVLLCMARKTEIIRHIPEEELERLYLLEKNVKIRERLLAVLLLYHGRPANKVAVMLCRSYSSIRRWKDAWNAGGYEALKPDYKGGHEPRISSSKWDEILGEIKDRAMTLKDVQIYVNKKYGVEYAYESVWYWLRKKKKAAYGKPYPRDVRRPANAEEVLKKPQ
jgi:transposase